MTSYVTGSVIRTLREKQHLTQAQLAGLLHVSDKAVSKWETGRGLPDITLLEPLARALSVSVSEMLAGEFTVNRNRSGNLRRSRFYVCPVCGNLIGAMGEGSFSCCGLTLPALEAEPSDAGHTLCCSRSDGDWFVQLAHPMSREHFISFIACVTDAQVQLVKLYPEQSCEARFSVCGKSTLYFYCNHHGLFSQELPGDTPV